MSIRYSDFGRKLNNDSKRNAVREFNESIRPSSSRELLYGGEFNIGAIVESDGKKQEILDVRSNYLVLIDESGQTKKKFAQDVKIIPEGKISYPENTFKGVCIGGEPIRQLVEDFLAKKFSDAFAVVKCAKLYNENREAEFEDAFSRLGYVVESTTEQLAVLRIIGDVLGVPPGDNVNRMITSIETKFKSMKMSPQQKKIFTDMVGLAKKKGVQINLGEDFGIGIEDDDRDERRMKHTAPGFSLGASTDTHRKQMVRRLKGLD